jgi:hypothetical protein
MKTFNPEMKNYMIAPKINLKSIIPALGLAFLMGLQAFGQQEKSVARERISIDKGWKFSFMTFVF